MISLSYPSIAARLPAFSDTTWHESNHNLPPSLPQSTQYSLTHLLHYRYGFQWRHFGAEYADMHADYEGKGVDQLRDCIHKIKTSPEDRRIIMTAWNPSDLDKMALPPCHMFCQFYVANGELSCQMYQRSADMGLGVPFNIASYSLLTVMMAQACDLKPGEFVHTIGDAHVYLNHVDALQEQILRVPKAFPKIEVNPQKTDIDSFEFADFTIVDYAPMAAIKMKMAV